MVGTPVNIIKKSNKIMFQPEWLKKNTFSTSLD